jgi:SRSO17 transposase
MTGRAFRWTRRRCPAETTLLGLVRVAGTPWTVEESFQAKTEVGLDHHQVRRWQHRRARRAHYSRRERQHWLQS